MRRIKTTKDKEQTKDELLAEIARLKMELKKKKKYGLVWEEKMEDVVEMCKEKLPVLIEDKSKAISEAGEDELVNILIEGENYHALSALNYTHQGKIDVIYIDPPYNKGNKNVRDFRYNDDFVNKDDPYKHSKWISFMSQRLLFARKLLKDSGLIYISIDDKEFAQLKLILDQIFLDNNFLTTLIWRGMHTVRNSSKDFNKNTEYILVYAKNKSKLIISGDKKTYLREFGNKDNNYPHNDNDGKGKYKHDPIYARNFYTPYTFKFKNGTIWNAPRGNYPRYSIATLSELENNSEIVFTGNEPKAKRYLNKVAEGVPPNSLLDNSKVGFNKDGTTELIDMFGDKVFDQPKPSVLIKYLLKITSKHLLLNRNPIIIDFFAGSGTTGQAVMELNKEDGGKRKFILVTNNENNICTEVCYPRISKVIKGYKNIKGKNIEGLGGNLKYYKTEFVDAKQTDRNKKLLTEKATGMLCIKEDTYNEINTKNKHFRIFKNGKKFTGIIYDYMEIDSFKKFIKKIDGRFSVYIFSLGDDTFDEEFEDLGNKVKLSPVPEAIMRVYRRVFK